MGCHASKSTPELVEVHHQEVALAPGMAATAPVESEITTDAAPAVALAPESTLPDQVSTTQSNPSELSEVFLPLPDDLLVNLSEKSDTVHTKPITSGWDVQAQKPIIVGYAPIAHRPEWLPKSGPGQANVDPLCWSLSVEQWIFFVHTCAATDTWRELAQVKGEYDITMYDINDHFVKPWTAGTGCSIALLMNASEPKPAEGMLSHAWAGSVCETYNCLQNMVNHSNVPVSARFFFCTFSMYQPQDGAPGGLTISEQIARQPFANVIASMPRLGMFVIHTTLSEVYERLWVAHEADVAVDANIQIRGLFDMYRFTIEAFESTAAVKTKDGQVGNEDDRAYIEALICKRGGYERLDEVIVNFRRTMKDELAGFLNVVNQERQESDGYSGGTTTKKFDWAAEEEHSMYHQSFSAEEWAFRSTWDRLALFDKTICASPLGRSSYPMSGYQRNPYCDYALAHREESVVLLASSFRVEYLKQAWFVERCNGLQLCPIWLATHRERLQGIFSEALLAEAVQHGKERSRAKLQNWTGLV